MNIFKNKEAITHHYIKRFKVACLVVVSGLLTSCASNALTVSSYKSQLQCINSQQANASFVTSTAADKSALVLSLDGNVNTPVDGGLDEQFWFVKVAMGQQSSAGFALQLLATNLELSNNVAQVSLKWLKPDPDAMTAQMVTNPCIYLQLEKGDYDQVEIVNQYMQQQYLLSTP